jgi:hypothetical protein
MKFTYRIKKHKTDDEVFYAYVTDPCGVVHFEITIDPEFDDKKLSDYNMKHAHDMSGLREYLFKTSVILFDDDLVEG